MYSLLTLFFVSFFFFKNSIMDVTMATNSIFKSCPDNVKHSIPVLPAPVQSPSMLMNKREENRQSCYVQMAVNTNRPKPPLYLEPTPTKPYKSDIKPHRLSQLTSKQQFQYETTKQMALMSNEIDFLTKKLVFVEEKVYKWKREFKNLHLQFTQITEENTKMREELDTTRTMLEESEHIRSRWFLKKPHDSSCSNDNNNNSWNTKKSPMQHQSLPSNLLRFFKLNDSR